MAKPKQLKRDNPYYQAEAILSRRDHSVKELKQKLKRKGFSAEQINTVTAWLIQRKLLNDEQMARRYVEWTLQSKAVGPRWLQFKLRERGINGSIIEKIVSEVAGKYPEEETAERAMDTWRRVHPQKANDRERLMRFLASRGFSQECISNCLLLLRD